MTGRRAVGSSITRARAVAIAAVVAGALTGCAAPADPPRTAGPPDTAPIVLRVGTDDEADRPASAQIRELAEQVAARSAGAITIEPVHQAAGVDIPDWDQAVARMAISGELEMALVPSRAWDTLGVTSLQALSAPFLIDRDDLVSRVVSDPMVEDLLGGLRSVEVVGLALLPEGLRHPFGFAAPLREPGDFDGGIVRAPTSQVTTSTLEALGARVTDAPPDLQVQVGMESSFALDPPGTATANVTFWPKVNVLVINQAVHDALSPADRRTLQEAAAATRDWAVAHLVPDVDAAADRCSDGLAVALASPSQLDALRLAVQPVLDELRRDPVTADLMAPITRLADTMPAAPVARPCEGPPVVAGDGGVPDGTYEVEVTDADLTAAGLSDPELADLNRGRFTFTLEDGRWSLAIDAGGDGQDSTDSGTYATDAERLVMRYTDGGPETYRWVADPDGNLSFEVESVPEEWRWWAEAVFVQDGWRRVR